MVSLKGRNFEKGAELRFQRVYAALLVDPNKSECNIRTVAYSDLFTLTWGTSQEVSSYEDKVVLSCRKKCSCCCCLLNQIDLNQTMVF